MSAARPLSIRRWRVVRSVREYVDVNAETAEKAETVAFGLDVAEWTALPLELDDAWVALRTEEAS